jgi:hypothetical protein
LLPSKIFAALKCRLMRGTIATFSRWVGTCGQVNKRVTEMGMPLGRYFVFMGSVLLAMLFLADWWMPKLAAERDPAAVDKTIIRIRSAQKWPEAIVIDTSLPTIVPSQAFADSTETPLHGRSTRQAFAQVAPEAAAGRAEVLDAATRPVQKRRARSVRTNTRRLASYDMAGFRNTSPAGW